MHAVEELEDGNDRLHKFSDKCREFIEAEGLDVKFDVFLHPKSIMSKLREKKEEARIREIQKSRDGIVDCTKKSNGNIKWQECHNRDTPMLCKM